MFGVLLFYLSPYWQLLVLKIVSFLYAFRLSLMPPGTYNNYIISSIFSYFCHFYWLNNQVTIIFQIVLEILDRFLNRIKVFIVFKCQLKVCFFCLGESLKFKFKFS